MKLKDWGERRWFVNSQGQTFAVIEGPVEFRMGSPPTETERNRQERALQAHANPSPVRHRRQGGHGRAVPAVLEARRHHDSTLSGFRRASSPSTAPIRTDRGSVPTGTSAAHYCNWLSEQEGLPKDQWCYLPNEAGAYAEGMSIPADVLERTGYRLPTEAEWEYACRAGAVTSRYYGHSIDLLDAYARYQANSKEHAWSCGSLFPNDLGLFDMLGNVFEWCQDSRNESKPRQKGIFNDLIRITESVNEKNPRLLRGGSFYNQPALVRSASRGWNAPAFRNSFVGFRPSKTCP